MKCDTMILERENLYAHNADDLHDLYADDFHDLNDDDRDGTK